MAYFFDTESQADLDLLHSSVRTDSELQNVVDEVEWEIVQAFSQRDFQGLTTWESFFRYENGVSPTDVIRVRLIGYDEDDPTQSDDGLKEVFKRSIANIASWTLRNYSNSQGVKRIRQGQREVEYSGVVPSWQDFPVGWDRLFKNYDARIQPYGI